MKRKFLEDLGLTKEQVDSIMAVNGDDIENAKSDFENIVKERDSLKTTLVERDNQLEVLKKSTGDTDVLKQQIEMLQKDNASVKEAHEAEMKKIQIESVVTNALTVAGAKNIKAVKALLDLESAELEGDSIKGLADQLLKLQSGEDSKFLFNESKETKNNFTGVKPGERKDGDPSSKLGTLQAQYDEALKAGDTARVVMLKRQLFEEQSNAE